MLNVVDSKSMGSLVGAVQVVRWEKNIANFQFFNPSRLEQ
jgi:hypothetical protein